MKIHAVSAALLAYVAATLFVPFAVFRLRWHSWPVVFHREADRLQKLVGALLALMASAGVAWAVALSFLPWRALSIWSAPGGVDVAGWSLLGAGCLLEMAGQYSMGASLRVGVDDRKTELVTSGLFAVTRNPVLAGLMISLLGVVLLTPSPWTVMMFLWAASIVAVQVRLEEAHLIRSHAREYLDYAARVGRFVPGLGKINSTDAPSVTGKQPEPVRRPS